VVEKSPLRPRASRDTKRAYLAATARSQTNVLSSSPSSAAGQSEGLPGLQPMDLFQPITFEWRMKAGIQNVIFVSRTRLH
jgi:hypothetical protein